MNPCIDCKIHFIKKAAAFMEESGALFVATGEVAGQRPMTQFLNIMNHILKASNLNGRLLRPLSAKLLKPTVMEEQGIVDREKLFSIHGRGRKQQLELAAKYKITEYASPAGGCLLTDSNIAARLRDLFLHHKDCNAADTYLLTVGRHFRLDNGSKLIVARNENEVKKLALYKDSSSFYFEPSFKGPSAIVRGEPELDIMPLAASIIRRYGRPDEKNNTIAVSGSGARVLIKANERIEEELLNKLRIN
jgi:tRNA U34 2-thiouridine synthase MnmA/TrmU